MNKFFYITITKKKFTFWFTFTLKNYQITISIKALQTPIENSRAENVGYMFEI